MLQSTIDPDRTANHSLMLADLSNPSSSPNIGQSLVTRRCLVEATLVADKKEASLITWSDLLVLQTDLRACVLLTLAKSYSLVHRCVNIYEPIYIYTHISIDMAMYPLSMLIRHDDAVKISQKALALCKTSFGANSIETYQV